jgi:hypothetical protein
MQLPGGFKAELIAAEPDLVQPIAFTFDERGRIWVVEGNSYPKPRESAQARTASRFSKTRRRRHLRDEARSSAKA